MVLRARRGASYEHPAADVAENRDAIAGGRPGRANARVPDADFADLIGEGISMRQKIRKEARKVVMAAARRDRAGHSG